MKKIYLLPVLAILAMNLAGQTNWVKHSGNPVMTAGPEEWEDTYISPGSVIFHEDIYHMWYSAGHFPGAGNEDFKIGHATSPDGIKWTKDENPVLDKGADGEWDGRGVFAPSVLLRDDVFHMWFTGFTSDGIFRAIGYATSQDGIDWVKYDNNPVLEKGNAGEWDDNNLKAPSVIFNGSEYHMYFDAHRESTGSSIGHASSPDGIVWTKDPQNPVLDEGGLIFWDDEHPQMPAVVFDGKTYHMWYAGGEFLTWDIGYATSEDGSSWTKHDVNPVLLKGGAESWESALVSFNTVIIDSSKFKMWYHGQRTDGTGGIGYAESDPRIPDLSVVKSKPVFDSTDIVIAEINLDGIIYIVPEGTSPVIDSIIKYKVVSAEALANTEIQIPLTELSIGEYTVIAVSKDGFVSTNLFFLELVPDAAPPEIILERDSVDLGNTINATSSKDGMLYLVIVGTTPDNIFIQSIRLKDSLQVEAGKQAGFPTIDLFPKEYLLYARDDYGLWSEAYEVSVVEVSTVSIVNPTTAEIHLYPNPTNKLLTIETELSTHYSIEITSLNGQQVLIGEMDGTTHQIDLSSIQKGAYFITISSKDFVTTRKIIKL